MTNGREKSPGFMFTKRGYDVWMANFRCNHYSERHQTLDAEVDIAYWKDCLIQDMAKHDLPAFIRYIKERTGVQ